ncbi:MAG: hypothetical protein ACRC2R_02330 [Xenococcaceae cyanobacterium]
MKSIFVSLLSVLLFLGYSPIAKAETQQQIKPFNLIFLARQGYFQKHNIPSNGAFKAAVKEGRVKAEDLVKAAIAENRLPSQASDDRSYLNRLRLMLDSQLRRS